MNAPIEIRAGDVLILKEAGERFTFDVLFVDPPGGMVREVTLWSYRTHSRAWHSYALVESWIQKRRAEHQRRGEVSL